MLQGASLRDAPLFDERGTPMEACKQKIKKIDLVLDYIEKIIMQICQFFMLMMVLVVCYSVFARFVLHNAPEWGEEGAIFCMVWVALLSSALAVRDGRHIRMTIIEHILPKKINRVLFKFIHVFILLVGIILLVYGVKIVDLARLSRMAALHISHAWLYASIPLSGLAIILMLLRKLREIL
jgi:TRAP-type C4-dicarboxylate transport system permease small subunit